MMLNSNILKEALLFPVQEMWHNGGDEGLGYLDFFSQLV